MLADLKQIRRPPTQSFWSRLAGRFGTKACSLQRCAAWHVALPCSPLHTCPLISCPRVACVCFPTPRASPAPSPPPSLVQFYWQDKGQDVSIVNAVAGEPGHERLAAGERDKQGGREQAGSLRLASALLSINPSLPLPPPHPTAIDNCVREPMGRNQCSNIRGELE